MKKTPKKLEATRAVQLVRKLFRSARTEEELREIWHIVTALRGPDALRQRYSRKRDFTSRIRLTVLTSRQAQVLAVSDQGLFHPRCANKVEWLDKNSPENRLGAQDHFTQHCAMAAMEIGYKMPKDLRNEV
jgi:hypothetical protein